MSCLIFCGASVEGCDPVAGVDSALQYVTGTENDDCVTKADRRRVEQEFRSMVVLPGVVTCRFLLVLKPHLFGSQPLGVAAVPPLRVNKTIKSSKNMLFSTGASFAL
jgi:hypothetical protein